MIELESHLRAAGRKLLVPYVTGGITADWTSYLLAYQAAGADAIEVGLPFSDPTLDGVTIQEASDRALGRGAAVEGILADLAAVSGELTVPIVAMTYANLIVRRGEAAFCAALKAAGFSGLIVPDLPLDEVSGVEAAAAEDGLALLLLAAPSTTGSRLREICARSRGCIYAISVMGTTGERSGLAQSAGILDCALKQHTELPVLLGFGVSSPDKAREASDLADGVVIGAALMRRVLEGATADQVSADLASMRRGMDELARV